jgi:hypothetical protein
MERKLSVGETLGEALRLYRDQAGVLLPVAFWLFLVVAILTELGRDNLAVGSFSLILSLTVTTLYGGIVVGLVRDLRDGRRDASVGDLFRMVTPVLLPLMGAALLAALGVFFGFFLLVVPGLYLLTIWAVVAPVIVVERQSVSEAFGRSRVLVRGSGWPVFWSVIAAFLIVIVVSVGLAAILISVADEPLLLIVAEALFSTFTVPLPALVAAVLYFRLLEIEDAQPAMEDSVLQQPGDGLG